LCEFHRRIVRWPHGFVSNQTCFDYRAGRRCDVVLDIGRREDNHVALGADNISRQHVAIERRERQYFICDLGSANGTYVNDRRTDLAQLNDGDRLRIGNHTISVSLVEQDCILNFKKITK
jgi:pSer/pThr/pTyr-binding forkhead associated (FHA) protein